MQTKSSGGGRLKTKKYDRFETGEDSTSPKAGHGKQWKSALKRTNKRKRAAVKYSFPEHEPPNMPQSWQRLQDSPHVTSTVFEDSTVKYKGKPKPPLPKKSTPKRGGKVKRQPK